LRQKEMVKKDKSALEKKKRNVTHSSVVTKIGEKKRRRRKVNPSQPNDEPDWEIFHKREREKGEEKPKRPLRERECEIPAAPDDRVERPFSWCS